MVNLFKIVSKNTFIKYPVVTYYLVTFLISWGGLVLLIGGPGSISSQPSSTPFLYVYLVTVSGPIVTSLVLTGLYKGKQGYSELFARLLKWRVPFKWYAIALLLAPITVFTTLFILTLFSPVYLPGIFSAGDHPVALMFGLPGSDKITLVFFVFMLGLFNGFVEELGWSGFAAPLLIQKQPFIKASISLGIMWGLWHLLSNYLGSAEESETLPLPLFISVLLFSFLPPFRIIMMWVYRHTGSLWIAILMHASLDMFWMLFMPISISGKERMIWYVLWAVVLWGVSIIIGLVDAKKNVSNPKIT